MHRRFPISYYKLPAGSLLPLLFCCLSGCGGGAGPVANPTAEPSAPVGGIAIPAEQSPPATISSVPSRAEQSATGSSPNPLNDRPVIPSISLSGGAAPAAGGTGSAPAGGAGSETDRSARRKQILAAMDPLQIVLGQWRGTTQKEVGDFKGLDEPRWVWDFKSQRDQPALVMESVESPYFKTARLTFFPERDIYQLTTTGTDSKERIFEGNFSAPAERYQGDDDRLHWKFKLELNQINGTSPRETWQVVFNQQDNNRYLMELSRLQGSRFLRFDTVATQRQGTSFAKSDDDYGERICIISGGLGTMQVSYQGKSYWVCCTGCKAAFEDDPATWIAEFNAKQKQ